MDVLALYLVCMLLVVSAIAGLDRRLSEQSRTSDARLVVHCLGDSSLAPLSPSPAASLPCTKGPAL